MRIILKSGLLLPKKKHQCINLFTTEKYFVIDLGINEGKIDWKFSTSKDI